MIERKFVAEKVKEFLVGTFMKKEMGTGKYSSFEIKKTPLGEKIIIYTSRPGLIVGKKGDNIKMLTRVLKTQFHMENPQIEVAEIENPFLDAQNMAEQIVNVLERFGPKRFKSTGYRTLQNIMDAGAMGAEIIISGRGLPGARAKSWRFYAGYLKKSGDVSVSKVEYGYSKANLNSGTVGIKIKILPANVQLPDKINIHKIEEKNIQVEVKDIEKVEEEKAVTKKKVVKKKTTTKKKTIKKKVEKKEETKDEIKAE